MIFFPWTKIIGNQSHVVNSCCWFKLIPFTRLHIAVPCHVQFLSHIWVGWGLSISTVIQSLNLSLLRIEIERNIWIDITYVPCVSSLRGSTSTFTWCVGTDQIIWVTVTLIVCLLALSGHIVLLSIALPGIIVKIIVKACRSERLQMKTHSLWFVHNTLQTVD